MTKLRRMLPGARDLVNHEFLAGSTALSAATVKKYSEGTTIEVDLTPVDEAIKNLIKKHEPYDSRMDALLAPVIHQTLPLSRRDASDLAIWQYLALGHYDAYVRHRWEYKADAPMREKFLGTTSNDIWTHALHRLWWVAELTVDEGDYTVAKRVLEFQQLANRIFDRKFARYKPAARTTAEVLLDRKATVKVVDPSTKRFGQMLTTMQLEAMDARAIKALVNEIADR